MEDEKAEQLKELLLNVAFVKSVETEQPKDGNHLHEPEMPYERLKKTLDSAKGKDLFKDIKDPSEWQRQIRKEWDRAF